MEIGDGYRCVGDKWKTTAKGMVEGGSKAVDVRSRVRCCAA